MKKLKLTFLFVVALLLIFGTTSLVYWTGRTFFGYVRAVPKEVGASLIAGVATILVATLTVTIGRYFERRKELDALYRDKKTEIYDEFLKKFLDLMYSGDQNRASADADDELVPFLREFMRKQILWSGPQVIESFSKWKDNLAKGVPDADSIFLAEQFLLSIRKDLRHSNFGLQRGFFARLFLREGPLFLALAAKNPKITLAEVSEAEKRLKQKFATGGATSGNAG